MGVALKPETPISIIEHLLRPKQLVHCVDILAVQPGFGGQPFDSSVLLKVQELRATCPQLDIQVCSRGVGVPPGLRALGGRTINVLSESIQA